MTLQQVFSLYLANPNQMVRFKCDRKTACESYGIDEPIDDVLEVNSIIKTTDGGQIVFLDDEENSYNISDCKLILKRIADMSEGDKKECRGLMLVGLMDKHGVIPKGFFDYGEWRYYHTYESILWLITHGYCLDEQWIENGWVTCQK